MQENFATNGFIEKMMDKNFGAYVIMGATGSGRSTLLLKYLSSAPGNVKSVIQADPGEYSLDDVARFSIDRNYGDIVKFAQRHRSAVVLSDVAHRTQDIQDLLMLSTMSNTAFTHYGDSISSFLTRMISDPDFWYGKRTMLERLKGITFTQSVVLSNKKRVYLQESLFLNSDNLEKFVNAEPTDLDKLVETEIVSQGMATIAQQAAALESLI